MITLRKDRDAEALLEAPVRDPGVLRRYLDRRQPLRLARAGQDPARRRRRPAPRRRRPRRALGAQNTGQFLAAAAVGPLVGALITAVGYPFAFLVVAAAPALAVPLVPPRSAEHDRL